MGRLKHNFKYKYNNPFVNYKITTENITSLVEVIKYKTR